MGTTSRRLSLLRIGYTTTHAGPAPFSSDDSSASVNPDWIVSYPNTTTKPLFNDAGYIVGYEKADTMRLTENDDNRFPTQFSQRQTRSFIFAFLRCQGYLPSDVKSIEDRFGVEVQTDFLVVDRKLLEMDTRLTVSKRRLCSFDEIFIGDRRADEEEARNLFSSHVKRDFLLKLLACQGFTRGYVKRIEWMEKRKITDDLVSVLLRMEQETQTMRDVWNNNFWPSGSPLTLIPDLRDASWACYFPETTTVPLFDNHDRITNYETNDGRSRTDDENDSDDVFPRTIRDYANDDIFVYPGDEWEDKAKLIVDAFLVHMGYTREAIEEAERSTESNVIHSFLAVERELYRMGRFERSTELRPFVDQALDIHPDLTRKFLLRMLACVGYSEGYVVRIERESGYRCESNFEHLLNPLRNGIQTLKDLWTTIFDPDFLYRDDNEEEGAIRVQQQRRVVIARRGGGEEEEEEEEERGSDNEEEEDVPNENGGGGSNDDDDDDDNDSGEEQDDSGEEQDDSGVERDEIPNNNDDDATITIVDDDDGEDGVVPSSSSSDPEPRYWGTVSNVAVSVPWDNDDEQMILSDVIAAADRAAGVVSPPLQPDSDAMNLNLITLKNNTHEILGVKSKKRKIGMFVEVDQSKIKRIELEDHLTAADADLPKNIYLGRPEGEVVVFEQVPRCRICWQHKVETIYTPCGHRVACKSCNDTVMCACSRSGCLGSNVANPMRCENCRWMKDTRCALCRTRITRFYPIF